MSEDRVPALDAAHPHTTEHTVRRSRFLAQCARASSLEEGRAFVESIRMKFPDATHHCWACVAGKAGDTGQIGFSDDGEPHGTAGRPMLQVLLHSGIGEICTVVTRWFGGVKLGTGGLVRAYQDAVRRNLENLPTEENQARASLKLSCAYVHFEGVQHALGHFGASVLSSEYGSGISMFLSVPETQVEPFRRTVCDLTRGTAVFDTLPQS
ncbi:MAG: YigZ family protein [Desulfovibrio sp.]|nr:YigZ family protein [Desulfovibrio sp.]